MTARPDPACTTRAESAAVRRRGRKTDPGDADPLPALSPGFCDFCGGRVPRRPGTPRKRFCAAACRVQWWRMARMRGGQLYQLAVLWRKHRGAKGTPGEGKIGEIAALVDRWAAEDRAAAALAERSARDAG
jgi:hypothetical protein